MEGADMKTTRGSLRNMTTGILHTKIDDVYIFLEKYLGADGIMTHQIPSACRALEPFLKTKLSSEWFNKVWEKENLDIEVEVPDMTEDELRSFWISYENYAADMWNSIKDKTIIVYKDK